MNRRPNVRSTAQNPGPLHRKFLPLNHGRSLAQSPRTGKSYGFQRRKQAIRYCPSQNPFAAAIQRDFHRGFPQQIIERVFGSYSRRGQSPSATTRQARPFLSGAPIKAHWSVPDPARAAGETPDSQEAFESAYKVLEARVKAFLRLPQGLDKQELARHLRVIGETIPG